MYRQFILREREVIAQMVSAGKKPAEIARRLGRHRASITRELKRNTCPDGYWPSLAHGRAAAQRMVRRKRIMEQPKVLQYVQRKLEEVLVTRSNRWPSQASRVSPSSECLAFPFHDLRLAESSVSGRDCLEIVFAICQQASTPPRKRGKSLDLDSSSTGRGGSSPTLWRLGRRYRGRAQTSKRDRDGRRSQVGLLIHQKSTRSQRRRPFAKRSDNNSAVCRQPFAKRSPWTTAPSSATINN